MSAYKLFINQGADFSFSHVFNDAFNRPIDLSGFTITAQLKRSANDVTPLASFVCVGDANGRVTITLDRSVTAALSTIAMVYDIRAQRGKYVYYLLRESKAILIPTVTRDVVTPQFRYTPGRYSPSPYSPRPYVG